MNAIARPLAFAYYFTGLDKLLAKLRVTKRGLAAAAAHVMVYVTAFAVCWITAAYVVKRASGEDFVEACQRIALTSPIIASNVMAVVIGAVAIFIAGLAIVCAISALALALFIAFLLFAALYTLGCWLLTGAKKDIKRWIKQLRNRANEAWERTS